MDTLTNLDVIRQVATACHDGSLDTGNDRACCQVVCTATKILLAERGIESSVLSAAAVIAHGRAPSWIAKHGMPSLSGGRSLNFSNHELQFIGCPSFAREAHGGVPDLGQPGCRLMHTVLIVGPWMVDPTLDQAEGRVTEGIHVFEFRDGLLRGKREQYAIPPIRGGIVIYEAFSEDSYFAPFEPGNPDVGKVVEAARHRLDHSS